MINIIHDLKSISELLMYIFVGGGAYSKEPIAYTHTYLDAHAYTHIYICIHTIYIQLILWKPFHQSPRELGLRGGHQGSRRPRVMFGASLRLIGR